MRCRIAVPDPRFGSLLSAVALFFVPTFFSGMVSPYAVRLLVQDRNSSGRHAGPALLRLDVRQRGRHAADFVLPRAAAGSEPDPARPAADFGRDRRLRRLASMLPATRTIDETTIDSCCRCSCLRLRAERACRGTRRPAPGALGALAVSRSARLRERRRALHVLHAQLPRRPPVVHGHAASRSHRHGLSEDDAGLRCSSIRRRSRC